MTDRWVPTKGYLLARVDGKILVLRHGRKHVSPKVPDDEIVLDPIATAKDYDEGVGILRALRGTMDPSDGAHEHS